MAGAKEQDIAEVVQDLRETVECLRDVMMAQECVGSDFLAPGCRCCTCRGDRLLEAAQAALNQWGTA